MISVFCWSQAKGSSCGGVELLPPPESLPDCLWIDLDNPTPDEERRIFEHYFIVHPLTLEDITKPRRDPGQPPHFPKVEEFKDYLFVIVNPLLPNALETISTANNGDEPHRLNAQLSTVLTHTILITHHYEPLVSIKELHGYLQKHDAQASRGPDYLFHLVLDVMVDQYIPILNIVDDRLDQIEVRVFSKPSGKLLKQLVSLKRRIIQLRKTIIHEKEVLVRLARGEFHLIDEREMVYYRNVFDHLVRSTELIEAAREMVSDLMQTNLAAQSNKLNEIMKVLTMISVTILPMSLIAGIYGMNFEKNIWPDFKESSMGFLLALGMMAMSGVGAFGLFRWMKWV